MNLDHAAALLAAAQMDDNRTTSPELVEWWADALPDVDADQAITALRHFRANHPDKYLTPWHLRASITAVRAEAMERARVAAIVPNVDPDDASRFAAEQRALNSWAADGRPVAGYAASGQTITAGPPRKAIGAAGDPGAVTDYASYRRVFPRRTPSIDRTRTAVEQQALARKYEDERAKQLADLEATYPQEATR